MKKIDLEISLFPSQAQIFNAKDRKIALVCGRRWGKTRTAICWIIKQALEKANSVNFWISPTYPHARIAQRYLSMLFGKQKIIQEYRRSERAVILINGSRIEFRSADSAHQTLAGEGLWSIIIDEAGMTLNNENLYFETLRPAMMDCMGRILLIGTPKGRNLFYSFFDKGMRKEDGWKSFHYPSHSGYMGKFKEELDSVKKELPDRIYRQEILAEFLHEQGSIFRYVKEASILPNKLEKQSGYHYCAGLDLARQKDYTALAIGYPENESLNCTYVDRWHGVDWKITVDRVKNILKNFGDIPIYVDATGIGDPIVEALQDQDIHALPFQFNNKNKKDIINNVAILLETSRLKLPYHENLMRELLAFEYQISASGNVKMQAPSGEHDDMVIALALCCWGLNQGASISPLFLQEGEKHRENYYLKEGADGII